jgi:hypothetical protein
MFLSDGEAGKTITPTRPKYSRERAQSDPRKAIPIEHKAFFRAVINKNKAPGMIKSYTDSHYWRNQEQGKQR